MSFLYKSSLLWVKIFNCSSGKFEKWDSIYSSSSPSGIASKEITNLLGFIYFCFLSVLMVMGSICVKFGYFWLDFLVASKWTIAFFLLLVSDSTIGSDESLRCLDSFLLGLFYYSDVPNYTFLRIGDYLSDYCSSEDSLTFLIFFLSFFFNLG